MKYRRFGKTELQIPVISCGGMRFQGSWRSGDEVSEECQQNLSACVRKAFESGIHHFETARGYGTSEFQLGRILPQLPRDEIIVQTKVGPNEDVAKFAETFELSMSLLQLDHIELLAFHGVNDEKSYENTLKCMDLALGYKKEGRIKHLGFSTHGPTDIIVKTIDIGVFDYVNLHWYYIFQDNWPAILRARELDMGVFIISPNDKGGKLYEPSDKLVELTQPLHPMAFNGLFCLKHPEVHTLSCGVAKPEDFDIHIEAVEHLDTATELIAPIEARLAAEVENALGNAWAESWKVGLPKWHDTPGEVNIPVILQMYTLAKAFDMIEYGNMRYNMLGNADSWFPGYKADKVGELDLNACLANSPHADVIPGYLAEAHELLKGEEKKRLQEDE